MICNLLVTTPPALDIETGLRKSPQKDSKLFLLAMLPAAADNMLSKAKVGKKRPAFGQTR